MNSEVEGLLACLATVVLLGCNYVPLRLVRTGDGLFAQWVMCLGVFCVGMVVQFLEAEAEFFPLAMLGGLFWALGNALTVLIVSRIGMALGLLLWSTTNLLMGWASGRFGLFGLLTKEIPPTERQQDFQYIGVSLTVASGFLFLFISSTSQGATSGKEAEGSPERLDVSVAYEPIGEDDPSPPSRGDQLMAMFLALVSGIFMGNTFNPVIYMQNHPEQFNNATSQGLPYVFAQFCGIFATSTFIFIAYVLWKQLWQKKDPEIPIQAFLPSFVAGSMWAIAQCMYFVANTELTEAGSYPIISRTPGVIGAFWGVFYFKEIRGRRNLLILTGAIGVLLVGKVFATLAVLNT